MTTLGYVCLATAAALTVYGIRWAWVNVAVVDALYNFEDDQATVDAEFAAITAGFEDAS